MGCNGEFLPDQNSIVPIKPVGLCEGGIPKANNTLEVPFEWSISGEANYTGFTIKITNKDDLSSQTVEITGDMTTAPINLERGKNYEWQVIGTSNLGTEIPSLSEDFFSETRPIEDNLPLPSKISINKLLTAIEVIWSNDNEDVDNLSYDLLLSSRFNSDEIIEDVTQLSYDQLGNTRSESDNKRELIPLSSLEIGHYIIQIKTFKTENGITNSSNSYARIKND